MGLLWTIPALPLLGALLLIASAGRLPRLGAAVSGSTSMLLAALATAWVGAAFLAGPATAVEMPLWTWISTAGLDIGITFYLDGLSLVMLGVVTGVGFLIHLYATGYMWDDVDVARFFAYMNLFVVFMLVLVLADNLVLLYLGWEGVGLASYLLIGFYHTDPENGYAARKAFVVTRVGDLLMALGLFLLWGQLGTLGIQEVLAGAQVHWGASGAGDPDTLFLICLLMLGGAVGKSAQVPLHTWLPDAMAGPTPVSALIHAATMVTAGVYLIARTHDLWLLAPDAQFAVAAVGLVSLTIAAGAALCQHDIKRILAYSTMSQIGYMFLALGVGAWSAGIFHLVTHAFFKALLFLSAGSVILALHHEQDVRKMGGLRKALPVPFWSMVIGCAALAALPLTSGWFSKDLILLTAFDSPRQGALFWFVACASAFLTALYSGRLLLLVFFGEQRTAAHDHSRVNMWGVLVVLALLSLGGGWFGLDPVAGVLPDGGLGNVTHGALAWLTSAFPIAGLLLAWLVWGRQRPAAPTGLLRRVQGFLHGGWGFDALYNRVIERPYLAVTRWNRNDVVDQAVYFITWVARIGHDLAATTANGRLRWYAANIAAGLAVALLLTLGVFT